MRFQMPEEGDWMNDPMFFVFHVPSGGIVIPRQVPRPNRPRFRTRSLVAALLLSLVMLLLPDLAGATDGSRCLAALRSAGVVP
jgi:hypothetical protein